MMILITCVLGTNSDEQDRAPASPSAIVRAKHRLSSCSVTLVTPSPFLTHSLLLFFIQGKFQRAKKVKACAYKQCFTPIFPSSGLIIPNVSSRPLTLRQIWNPLLTEFKRHGGQSGAGGWAANNCTFKGSHSFKRGVWRVMNGLRFSTKYQ